MPNPNANAGVYIQMQPPYMYGPPPTMPPLPAGPNAAYGRPFVGGPTQNNAQFGGFYGGPSMVTTPVSGAPSENSENPSEVGSLPTQQQQPLHCMAYPPPPMPFPANNVPTYNGNLIIPPQTPTNGPQNGLAAAAGSGITPNNSQVSGNFCIKWTNIRLGLVGAIITKAKITNRKTRFPNSPKF